MEDSSQFPVNGFPSQRLYCYLTHAGEQEEGNIAQYCFSFLLFLFSILVRYPKHLVDCPLGHQVLYE